jgi:secreted trypsin-like serine protease
MQAIFVLFALAILAGLGHTQNMPKPGVCGVSKIKPKSSRIVNGEPVIPHSRPYQLLLVGFFPNQTAKFYCGASLITPTHALTAAHCVVGNAVGDIRIFPAIHNFTSDLLQSGGGIPARQIFSHESYTASGLVNDVAVVRLQTAVTVDNEKYGLICLPESSSPVCASGNPVVASGWGSTTGDPNRPSSSRPVQLQQVALQCVDAKNADCKSLTYLLGIIAQPSKMCAYAPNKGVCFGDSGGPLVRERTLSDGTTYLEQVGIMSGTVDCSFTKPRPDIYANVRQLLPWILNKVAASP